MDEYQKQVGLRLRHIREIMNEGSKLSAEQFAYLVNETGDRIRNYELGRASIPIRLLYNLYNRGINPNFIITGDGKFFAENEEGQRLYKLILSRTPNFKSEQKELLGSKPSKKIVTSKKKGIKNNKDITISDGNVNTIEDILDNNKNKTFKAVAGKIDYDSRK